LDAFETDLGVRADLLMVYQDWAHFPFFEPNLFDPILERGACVMLTWEPWDHLGTVDQPDYGLARILDGSHDAHIIRWARAMAAWGRPLDLRFAHEMNGTWYPWSEGVNSNVRGDYVLAWRHVRKIFADAGASNVAWVWSPMADATGYTPHAPLEPLYPGDDAVDQVGMDGYNWGTSQAWGSWWQSPGEIFDATLGRIRAMTNKPLLITETASTEEGGDKARWIGDLFEWASVHPEVESIIWFDHDKETDWRVRSSLASSAAFKMAMVAWGTTA